MKADLQKALDNVDMTYTELVEIADDIINTYTQEVESIIESVNKIENLTNDMVRDTMLKLSLQAFRFSNVKEKSSLKAECAEILRKEAYAKSFNAGDGSVANRDNNALLNISNEILSETVYNLVADLFKTKLDEIHRVVDTLKTILMSRMAEAKLTSIPSVD